MLVSPRPLPMVKLDRSRWWRKLGALAGALALWASCGDEDAAPPIIDPCEPHLAADWRPQWRPPHAPQPGACTAAQIDLEYKSCEGPDSTRFNCLQFRSEPANDVCFSCMFSGPKDPSYGAFTEGHFLWTANTPGCIALTDGDQTENGCGARLQAATACSDAACEGCGYPTPYIDCLQQADHGACRGYWLDTGCASQPEYAICNEYATSKDYFIGTARFFCASGVSAAASGDARAPGPGPR
jgi:hypothetical protein